MIGFGGRNRLDDVYGFKMGKTHNNWKGTIIYENKQSLLSNRKNFVVALRNKNDQRKFEVIKK